MKNWLIILALFSTNSVSAAKTPEWIGMGIFQDEQVYVNVNSQSHQGDIASVSVKLGAVFISAAGRLMCSIIPAPGWVLGVSWA